jgi:hypothetical protein
MVAGPRKRVHRTRPTGQLARRPPSCGLLAGGHDALYLIATEALPDRRARGGRVDLEAEAIRLARFLAF